MRNFIFLFLCFFSSLSATDRLYFDARDSSVKDDALRIHTGHNIWIQTSAFHKDVSGTYTLEEEITRQAPSFEYVKHWKCPYCHHFWPIGTPCQNPDCPSKYKY